MPAGLQTIADIRQPKSRSSTALSGYVVTAVAMSPETKTTEVGWSIYRMSETTGDVDYAKDSNGNPTDEYIFTGVDIHLHDFDE